MNKRGIISSEGIVYGGLDESNNGKYPTVYSLVLSGFADDIIKKIGKQKLSKAKKISRMHFLKEKVLQRGHTFLIVNKIEYERIGDYKKIGQIVASLSEDFLPLNLNEFYLHLDGKTANSRRLYTRDLIADCYNFSKKQIKIEAGGNYDRRYPIVNFADCMARYYFTAPLSLKKISESPYKRELQYFN